MKCTNFLASLHLGKIMSFFFFIAQTSEFALFFAILFAVILLSWVHVRVLQHWLTCPMVQLFYYSDGFSQPNLMRNGTDYGRPINFVTNRAKMTFISHKMVKVVILCENSCHLLRLQQKSFSSQLEISHMFNGTTLEIQHRKWGPKRLLIKKPNYDFMHFFVKLFIFLL